jgi:hypothetical protein
VKHGFMIFATVKVCAFVRTFSALPLVVMYSCRAHTSTALLQDGDDLVEVDPISQIWMLR